MRLTIPDPALVLLVGPSGAGKTTFAAAHFRPTEIVSSDAMREMLADDAGDQDASAEAFQVLTLVVNGRLRRRLTTVVDATNLRGTSRRQYRRIAARYGIPSVAVAFDFPASSYAARNAGRTDRVVPESVVADQAARMATALAELPEEGHAAVWVLRESQRPEALDVQRRPARGPVP